MAEATYTPTTTTNINKLWRTVQTAVMEGIGFESEEYQLVDDIKKFDVEMSTRSITVPLDINEDYEARPNSPNVEELTLDWVTYNGRFTTTLTQHWVSQVSSGKPQLRDQFKYQGAKKVQAMGRRFSDRFYGTSDGTICLVNGNPGAATDVDDIPVDDAFGQAGIDTAAYIMAMAKVGDYVAAIRSAALVSNGIGVIDALDTMNSEWDITFNGSCDLADGDAFVFANSIENTTITGTAYNLDIVGLVEALTATTLHGLASSSVADWDVAGSDTAAGRISGVKLKKARDEIKNASGDKMDLIFMSQGVERDFTDLERALLRWSTPQGMDADGTVKFGNAKFHISERVPPKHVACAVKRRIKKLMLLPKPEDGPSWGDGRFIPDRMAMIFSVYLPIALVWLKRSSMYYFNNLTEQ